MTKLKKHTRILDRLLDRRKQLTIMVCGSPTRKLYLESLQIVFGCPDHCLLCGVAINLGEREPALDLDTWFCSICCPVCAA